MSTTAHVSGVSNPRMQKVVWFIAIVSLATGGLAAILMTEVGQMLNLPRGWVFITFEFKRQLSWVLFAVTAGLLLWQFRHRSVGAGWMASYVVAMLGLLFFINLFAPYIWLRAQQHDAEFVSVATADALLLPDEDVLVLEINGDARAYPRDWIMVPHIAGDLVGGEEVVMTYCALSDLPQAFTTRPSGQPADYRVIAQVNNNLIFSDTHSGELYQQITGRGEYSGNQPRQYPVQRMPWHAFRSLYPQGKVFKPHTNILDGFTIALFENALVDHYAGDPLFPTISLQDTRLPAGEPVWGLLVNGEALAVPGQRLGDTDRVLRARLGDRELLLAWFAQYQTLGAFYADRAGQSLDVGGIDPYGNTATGKLERVHLFPGVLWMVWSHWYPDTRLFNVPDAAAQGTVLP